MEKVSQNNVDLDLQMMREQLMLLQKKLDEHICIEESMLHKSMKKSVSSLLLWEWTGLFLCVVAFFFVVTEVHQMHLSHFMQIFTIIFMGIVVCVQMWSVWYVRRKQSDVINGNLLRAGQRILVYKRVDRWCKRIFVPVMLLWVVCYLHETVASSPLATASAGYRVGIYVGGLIGAFIGGSVGWIVYSKMLSQVNELEQQINDMKRL